MTTQALVDWLRQFDPDTEVVLNEDDVETPGEFVSIEAAFREAS